MVSIQTENVIFTGYGARVWSILGSCGKTRLTCVAVSPAATEIKDEE